jgi:hypothetical protein
MHKLLGEQGPRHPNFDFTDFKKKLKDQPGIIEQRLETEFLDQSSEDPFIKHNQDFETDLRKKSLAQIKFHDSTNSGADTLLIYHLTQKNTENHYKSSRNHPHPHPSPSLPIPPQPPPQPPPHPPAPSPHPYHPKITYTSHPPSSPTKTRLMMLTSHPSSSPTSNKSKTKLRICYNTLPTQILTQIFIGK